MPSLRFLARHFWPFSVPVPDADLSGVSAIVTGATSGLGYATAEYLVKHGVSTLVLGCRNLEKGAEVKEKLLEFAPHKDQCQIHVWKLDLASFDSVIAFHKQVQQLEDVHIFISNAGIAPSKDWKFSEDGWEESLQVNALSTGMLAHLILGDMAKTADASKVRIKPHMVFVTSSGHYDVDFVQKDAEKILETINDPFSYPSKDARPYELYKIAKLFNIFTARELAMLPAAANITINACCPGFCATNLLNEAEEDMSWIARYLYKALAWSAEYGSRTIAWAAVSPTSPGAYIEDCQEVKPLDFIDTDRGQEVQKQVWQEMVKLWIKKDADIRLLEASAP